jgi:hypothetical protein
MIFSPSFNLFFSFGAFQLHSFFSIWINNSLCSSSPILSPFPNLSSFLVSVYLFVFSLILCSSSWYFPSTKVSFVHEEELVRSNFRYKAPQTSIFFNIWYLIHASYFLRSRSAVFRQDPDKLDLDYLLQKKLDLYFLLFLSFFLFCKLVKERSMVQSEIIHLFYPRPVWTEPPEPMLIKRSDLGLNFTPADWFGWWFWVRTHPNRPIVHPYYYCCKGQYTPVFFYLESVYVHACIHVCVRASKW